MAPEILAHLKALAGDKHEALTPRTCSLCKAAESIPEAAGLVATIRGHHDGSHARRGISPSRTGPLRT